MDKGDIINYEEENRKWKETIFNTSRQDLNNILNNDSKNLDFFEEKITFLSAGAIGLSLTFLDYNITNSLLYKISVIILLITLLANLYSYLLSVRFNKKVVEGILYAGNPDQIEIEKEIKRIEKQKSNNRFFTVYNEICFFLFLIGVIMLVLSIFMLNNKTLTNNNESKKSVTAPLATTVIAEQPKNNKK